MFAVSLTTVSGSDPTPAAPIAPAADTSVVPPCPAYLGPQCDTPSHERWATGQQIVDDTLGLASLTG